MEPEQREACERRRGRLAAQLGNRPALIAAGTPRPRNYAANLYPFRASSHFLYLFALPLRGAVAFYDGASWTLYLPQPGADDALWEGPQPSLDAIADDAGCPARPLSRLPANIRGRAVATLPAPDLETCAEQSRLLGREIRRGVLDVLDAPLADALIELRLVHDATAVAELRRAAEATAAAHRAGMRVTRAGLTEAAVCATMEAALAARGMTCAYPSIVTVHGEVLHNERHDNVLAEDDLLLCDVGAETPGGWAGDVTRTWPVNGKYSTPQRELYQVVLSAQRQAIAAVTPGARYRNIHLLACQALAGGLCELGVLRGNPIELVADGVLALLFPHGVFARTSARHGVRSAQPASRPRPRARHGRHHRARPLRRARDPERSRALEEGLGPPRSRAPRDVRGHPGHSHRRRRARHRRWRGRPHRGHPQSTRRRRGGARRTLTSI
jgi:Xaa-Pro aminopeptidase